MKNSSFVLTLVCILFLFVVGCSSTNKVSNEKEKESDHGVVLVEEGGEITWHEELLLRRLHDKLIPLPDTIVFTDSDKNGKGWVKIWHPNKVYLSTSRHDIPNHNDQFYLYGREEMEKSNIPIQTHVLAHEIGHTILPNVDHKLGRPALGLASGTQETEAEIVGLVLMDIAFGTNADQLGFPDVVEYQAPSIKDKSVKRLQYQYCHIIKSTWSLTDLSCKQH